MMSILLLMNVLLLMGLCLGRSAEAKKSFTFSKPTTVVVTTTATTKNRKNRKNISQHDNRSHIGTNIVGGFTSVHHSHTYNYRPTTTHGHNNNRNYNKNNSDNSQGHILRGILRSDRNEEHGYNQQRTRRHRRRHQQVPNTDPYSLHKHHYVHKPVVVTSEQKNFLALAGGSGGISGGDVGVGVEQPLEVEHHRTTNAYYMSIGGGGSVNSNPNRWGFIRRRHHNRNNGKLQPLSSSITSNADYNRHSGIGTRGILPIPVVGAGVVPAGGALPVPVPLRDFMAQQLSSLRARTQSSVTKIDVQDCAVYLSYLCSMAAITLPVILIPMIAADPYRATTSATATATTTTIGKISGADLAAKIVSTSSLGAALGKFINGFVCQSFGSRKSAGTYFVGLATFSLLLSTTSTYHARAIAGMEFCSSIMWVACNVLIANKYAHDGQKFGKAITLLSLCSTVGSLSVKVVGSALLGAYHWRNVALISTLISTIGAFLMFFVVKDGEDVVKRSSDGDSSSSSSSSSRRGLLAMIRPFGRTSRGERDTSLSLQSIASSMTRVLSNKMFWLVALAHSCSFLGRSSDKILGTFLVDITKIPGHVCASLTTSVTLGFIAGLVSGRKMESMDEAGKRRFIIRRQCGAILSALSIALFANQKVVSILGRKVVAAAITLASCLMTASLSIQFYQFPSKFAKSFGDDKAVCVAFTDALAYFLCSPIWAIVSSIASNTRFGPNGWSVAWIFVSAMFAVGGGISLKTMKETL